MNGYEHNALRLRLMGHPVRLQILDMLRAGETCVCHIERALDKRQAYVSQQLMALREAGLVEARKDGLQVYYRLNDTLVRDLLDVLMGLPENTEPTLIEGCRCPACASIDHPVALKITPTS